MSSLRQRRIAIACMLSESLREPFALTAAPPQSETTVTCKTRFAAVAPFLDAEPREQSAEEPTAPQDTPTFEQVKERGPLPALEVACVARKISDDFGRAAGLTATPARAERSEAGLAALSFSEESPALSDRFLHLRADSLDRQELPFLQRASALRARRPSEPAEAARRSPSPRAAPLGRLLPGGRTSLTSIQHFDIDQTTKLRKCAPPRGFFG